MSRKEARVIATATDGACSGNPGPGGWAALIRFEDGSQEELGGFEANTTNNRMELKAALGALERLSELHLHPNLKIKTDSKYLINGLSKWIHNWKRKGWLTSAGKPVLNKDLWIALDKARIPSIPMEHVKGHSGNIDNERVDKIAVAFSKGQNILNQSTQQIPYKSLGLEQKSSVKTSNKDLAPDKLQKLLSRLDMINQFAEKEYGLTLSELANLLDKPLDEISQKNQAWLWREWIIEPINNELWKVRKNQAPTKNSLESNND